MTTPDRAGPASPRPSVAAPGRAAASPRPSAAPPGRAAATPGPDLARSRDLEAAWAARVRADREQAERVREAPAGDDFYAPVSSMFVADPRRTDDVVLDTLLTIARPGQRWLDVGAGAGRFALPLALVVDEVIALEPSAAMLAALVEQAARHGIGNIRPVAAAWPPADPALAEAVRADVVLVAHLGYDIEAIGPFVDALEAAARRDCVAVLDEGSPVTPALPFWPLVHGEERVVLPSLPEFLELLEARGRRVEVTRSEREPRAFGSRETLLAWFRNQLFVAPGSAADERLLASLEGRVEAGPDGLRLADSRPRVVAVVRWPAPGAAA